MTYRHSHHKYGTLKSDRLNAHVQFSEPTIGSCERALRCLVWKIINQKEVVLNHVFKIVVMVINTDPRVRGRLVASMLFFFRRIPHLYMYKCFFFQILMSARSLELVIKFVSILLGNSSVIVHMDIYLSLPKHADSMVSNKLNCCVTYDYIETGDRARSKICHHERFCHF